MQILAAIPQYGFWFLLLLTVLVFVHEMGHFLVARWCGVRVEVFSIGFGPELLGFTDRKGTRWRFSAVPLGGYVRMFGQEGNVLEGAAEKAMSPQDRAVAFDGKSVWRRAAIVAAGPIANFIFAILVLTAITASLGKPMQSTQIGEVVPGSAASQAGLQVGDKIVSINGSAIESFDEIKNYVVVHLDRPLDLGVTRDSQLLTINLIPQIVEESSIFGTQRVGRIGIRTSGEGKIVKLSVVQSAVEAVREVYDMSGAMLIGIGQIVSGKRSSEDIQGGFRMAKMTGEAAKAGFLTLVSLAAMISVNLGLVNLLPIPMLDGGHLAYYAVEAIRGRPLGARAQEWGLRLGVAFVLSLMVFATWNDIKVLLIKALLT
ncbi:MAG TPA: RIP metalloprotease RseP [Dongiaceae bacterium]